MDREYAIFKVKDFIGDCYKLNYEQVVIIHGIGSGVLAKTVTNYLKTDKRVLKYELDFLNPGCTVVWLKVDKSNE